MDPLLKVKPETPELSTRYSFLAALVIVLAAALRLIALDRLPPGLFYDESANGIDALRVLAGAHPVFFVGNQGREPLLIYLQAATFALIGPSPLATRIPSAMLGILTVAATFTTFRALFTSRIGLIAASLLAVSFWHISLSRLAFRAVALPLFATLATFWLWKATRTGKVRHFALAGLFLGIDLYTYIPSRLVPALLAIWLLGIILIPAWRKGPPWPRVVAGGIVCAIVFTLTVLPLAGYYARHPGDFIGRVRSEQQSGPITTRLTGFERSLEALARSGDQNPRQDLPGRPLLDVPVTLALIVGLIAALRHWRDGASILVLTWCIAMLAPAALSREPAHALRLVGELPFALALAALGFDWLIQIRWPSTKPLGLIALGLIIAGSGAVAARDYFVVWPDSPTTHAAFDAEALHAPRLLTRVPPIDTRFVTTISAYEGSPIPLSLLPHLPTGLRAFDGRRVFVTPANSAEPVFYAYAPAYLPNGGIPAADHLRLVDTTRDEFGQVNATLYRMDPPLRPPAPAHVSHALIGSAIKVTGVDVEPVISPGDSEHFALHWTVTGRLPPGDWIFFAHLVGRASHRLLGQDYNQGFPPDQWRIGDRVVTSFTIPVAGDAAPTVADVDAGILDQTNDQRLPLTDPTGKPAGDALVSGPVRVGRPIAVPPPEHPLTVRFGSAIDLLGYDLEPADSGSLALRLHWTATHTVNRDYTVFVHLVDATGQIVTGADSQPGQGSFPTSTWRVGETVLDTHLIRPAGGMTVGAHVEVGIYLLATGQRLTVASQQGQPLGDFITIHL